MAKITQIRKRDGRVVPFEPEKITNAILKAFIANDTGDGEIAKALTKQVTEILEKKYADKIPGVEGIQDTVEEVLIKNGYADVARAYILYRQQRTELRAAKAMLGVTDDLKLNINAIRVLQRRYLLRDEQGNIIETPSQLFRRVAKAIAVADKLYGETPGLATTEEEFYKMMANLEFIPNSPTLMNAGAPMGQLAACFTAEQPIMTAAGIKPIRDVKIGDLVLTASGMFGMVTKTMQRLVNKKYLVSVWKLPAPTLSVTEKHPILSLREGQPKWLSAGELRQGDYVAVSFPREIEDVSVINLMDFLSDSRYTVCDGKVIRKNIDERLRSGPISHQVEPVQNEIKVDDDLMRLFGYYASEGDVDRRSVRFTFSESEQSYAQDVIRIVKDRFGLRAKIEHAKAGRWINVRFHSTILCEFFDRIMGRGFDQKKIPPWMLKLPLEKQKGFIVGCFRGDSTLYINRHTHNARLVMCNPSLVWAVWTMLMRMGLVPRLYAERMPALDRTIPYSCAVTSADAAEFMEETYSQQVRRPTQLAMQRKRELIVSGMVFLPIRKIVPVEEEVPVYNFEVRGEHTYVANGVAVHNCFVIPIEDSIEGIFGSLRTMALIHQSGGGTGFSFSKLRPSGDIVKSTKGVASGPVSFMRIFDVSTDVIKQGGKRRGANMGVLRVDHPDILEFITSKVKEDALVNFNISVGVTDAFMEAVEKEAEYDLINPRSGKSGRRLNAKEVFDLIVNMAWRTGDPGIIFLDEINRHNPTPNLGKIESTNPCGEVPLLPYESCILGSINLAKMIKDGEIDWEKFRKVVRNAVHFLDNVIDVNKYPIPDIEKMTKLTRKIGLGIMGFAEMLLELGIPYDTEEALSKANEVMKFISEEGRKMSVELAERRGSFPAFPGSLWEKRGYKSMRNATVTTIAPTGTISIIAGTTSGIEPLFAVAYVRNVMSGIQLIEVNQTFERLVTKRGFHNRELMLKLSKLASIKKVQEIPEDVRKIFVTAFDVTPEWHVRMQAVFQKYTDNAVSKTINLPNEATPEDVRRAYMLAYMMRCKGITIYRYGSKAKQVLSITPQSAVSTPEEKYVKAEPDYSGGRPSGEENF